MSSAASNRRRVARPRMVWLVIVPGLRPSTSAVSSTLKSA
jgi:hypothetical protein